MAKNYYWNQGCTFPITKKDVIDGRAYMFLEAIRKLIFLIENPQAGYYREDYPQVIEVGGSFVPNVANGQLLGTLPVYRAGDVYMASFNETTEEWETISIPYWDGNNPSWD